MFDKINYKLDEFKFKLGYNQTVMYCTFIIYLNISNFVNDKYIQESRC